MNDWQPPETAPKNGKAFLITTAGPEIDVCAWVEERGRFEDYFFKQGVKEEWPYMIAWTPLPAPAKIGNSKVETYRLNGWA